MGAYVANVYSSGAGFVTVVYSDGSTAVIPAMQAGLPQYQVGASGSGTATSTPPGGGSTAPSSVQPGQTLHYLGYAIIIQTVGTGGSGGLMTTEGVQLPLGTVYKDTADGSIWSTTGPNTATQVTGTAPPSGGTQTTQLVETISVDANGNLVWSFDPLAPKPYQIAYSSDGSNWTQLANPATQAGSISLAMLSTGIPYTIVLHAGGLEVARTAYTPSGAAASAQGTPIDTTTGLPLVPTASGASSIIPPWFTDPSRDLISGVPNWGLVAAGAAVLFAFKKKLI